MLQVANSLLKHELPIFKNPTLKCKSYRINKKETATKVQQNKLKNENFEKKIDKKIKFSLFGAIWGLNCYNSICFLITTLVR